MRKVRERKWKLVGFYPKLIAIDEHEGSSSDNWKPHSADWLYCILDDSLVIIPLLIGCKLQSLRMYESCDEKVREHEGISHWKPHSADWLDFILDDSLVIMPLLIGWKLKSLRLIHRADRYESWGQGKWQELTKPAAGRDF